MEEERHLLHSSNNYIDLSLREPSLIIAVDEPADGDTLRLYMGLAQFGKAICEFK